MDINYLYVDDESIDSLESLTSSVSGTFNESTLKINPQNPSDFNLNLEELINGLSEYQGLILDWRLDKLPNEGKFFQFRAGSVAQEIRIRQAEGSIKSIPIVLWSTNENLQDSYTSDTASHDLFDQQHDKIKIQEDTVKAQTSGIELISLATGYPDIKANLDDIGQLNLNVFNLDDKYFELLPKSFVEQLKQLSNLSVHEYARIFIKEIIQRPGVLVSEELLAAKLGISIESSSDWNSLIELIGEFVYRGPFHQAWRRWWWHLIEKNWWSAIAPKGESLRSLNAEERVSFIKDTTKLQNLMSAQGIKPSYQTNFQTICEYYRKPLDSIDGVTIKEKEPFMWQEKRYLSLDAVLRRLGSDEGLRPHPVEIERINLLKSG
jgi:hypothetical protein